MEQTTPKKAWLTPELIVLVRSNPEESVLFVCKGGATGGPVGGFGICSDYLMPACASCNGNATS
jgi:hypothetical protein